MTPGSAPGRAADRARTIFLGSGAFAVPILEALARHPSVELVGVVTAPDRPAGRGKLLRPTPVALLARSMWMPLLQPARLREPEAIAQVADLRPELGVLADYGQIVPRDVLELPRLGILNVHPSLLPRHRGAAPIQAAIAGGDDRTGVTIIRMDEGVDTGPIVAATDWPMVGTERASDVEAFAAREAAALLDGTLDRWLAGTAPATPQDDAAATTTRTLRRADGRLDPASPAQVLERRIRAYEPWPGTYLETPVGRLAVHAASTAAAEPGDVAGRLERHGDRLALTTVSDRLVLDEVQLAGRRAMRGDDFLRGQPELAGIDLGAAEAVAVR